MPPERGFKYCLTILDGFTRFAWVIPLKTKPGLEVATAFQTVFKESKRRSERVCVDEGKEFYNQHMYKLYSFSKDNIRKTDEKGEYINKLYSIYGESKNALIERFNRTITLISSGLNLIYKETRSGYTSCLLLSISTIIPYILKLK